MNECLEAVNWSENMAIEDSDGILNAAGYWTIGVAQGLSYVAVPVVVFSIMAGFALKLARIGAKAGGR